MALQTLDRAMAALRLLGGRADGMRLTDIQNALGLSKPTTHRLLVALMAHDLVRQERATRLYWLGAGLDTLRWTRAESKPDLKGTCMPSVLGLAEESGDTVFLVVRDRMETVCIARESGSYPIRAITVELGTRRPLGLGAGGLSILGALPAAEARMMVASLGQRLAQLANTSAEQILRSSDNARQLGYSYSDEQVVKGVRGLAVSIRDRSGAPIAAIGIAAINERLRTERVAELVELLKREATAIERQLAATQRG